jgi:SPP1 gp7 family putative phage head morphogenesis protein
MKKSNKWEYDELMKYGRLDATIKKIEEEIKAARRDQYKMITGLLIYSGLRRINTTLDDLKDGKVEIKNKDTKEIKKEMKKPWSGDTMKDRYNKGTVNEIDRVRQSIVKGAMDEDYRESMSGIKKAVITTATAAAVSILVSEKTHLDKELTLKRNKKVEYNAILDSVTCNVCAGRDGNVYEADQAPALPAHVNCRCFYTPLEEK